jgi:hypothetical protein
MTAGVEVQAGVLVAADRHARARPYLSVRADGCMRALISLPADLGIGQTVYSVGCPQEPRFRRLRVPVNRRYLGSVITSVLGAPGSGKSTIAPVLDWDAFIGPAAALAGREIPGNPETWPAYRELVHAVIGSIAHLPVVLLGVCTPDELKDWPVDAWVLLDCTEQERRSWSGRIAPLNAARTARTGNARPHQLGQVFGWGGGVGAAGGGVPDQDAWFWLL